MKHWWFRSCIGKDMTCEEGYLDTGDNQLHTSCCSEDHCNDGDPTVEFPAESTSENPTSSLSCYHCGWSEISEGGESVDCIQGTNLEDRSVNCEEEGWGSECISRVLKTGEKQYYFRSCVGRDWTCEEGYEDYDDNELWTSCCSEDNCNDGDPTIEFPAVTTTEVATGLHCYTCDWENTSDGGDCVSGNNLEDTSVNCAAEGWGDGCITRVYRGYDGEEQYFRSCIGEYMTCVDGYVDYGDYGELWTSCCSEDNCNDGDPTIEFPAETTTEISSTEAGISCYFCGWEDLSLGGDCGLGNNLEETSIDCMAEGWGNGCISRTYKDPDGNEQLFRSCIGLYMSCEIGYGNYGEYGELWTSCCYEDDCNDDDPKEAVAPASLECYFCGWDFESDGGACVTGENLEDTSINCEEEGWGDGCITRVFQDADGEVQYFRSCIGKYMTCVDGYGDYGESGELWTSCCNEDNCNDDDPKENPSTTVEPPIGLYCFKCGWDYASDGGDCVTGENLEDTSINCEAEGWGNGCITNVFRNNTDGTVQYFRSCIGNLMTCEDGYINGGELGERWTSCCETDNCNDDDPKDALSSTTASTTIGSTSTTESTTTEPTTMSQTTDPNTASGLQMSLTLLTTLFMTLLA